MPFLYALAYVGVAFVVLATLFETLRSVSRKPVWSTTPVYEPRPRHVVEPIDVLPVDPRHSSFAGLSNDEDFQLTA